MNKTLLAFFCSILLITALFSKTNYKEIENTKDLVVLIHGLGDSHTSMLRLQKEMNEANYSVLNFEYKSTKWTMDSIICELDRTLNKYQANYDSIHFVVHSMGTFVVRSYLAKYSNPKFINIVMIAPPNKGSILAEKFGELKVFEWSFGESGQKLGKEIDDFWRTYPRPRIPFGIIAGGIDNRKGINPMIPGDDDGVVGVTETVLRGYSDIIKITGLHSSLPWQKQVIQQAMYFMKHEEFQHKKEK